MKRKYYEKVMYSYDSYEERAEHVIEMESEGWKLVSLIEPTDEDDGIDAEYERRNEDYHIPFE